MLTAEEQLDLERRFEAADKNGVCWKTNKQRHARRRDAKRSARSAERRSGRRIRVYECPHCDGWHLTKARQR